MEDEALVGPEGNVMGWIWGRWGRGRVLAGCGAVRAPPVAAEERKEKERRALEL